jgi:hypothetical protein
VGGLVELIPMTSGQAREINARIDALLAEVRAARAELEDLAARTPVPVLMHGRGLARLADDGGFAGPDACAMPRTGDRR